MKKKVNYKEAANKVVERLESAFRAKTTDVWHGKSGSIITFELPLFSNSIDVMSEAGLCIASAKYRGLINDGAVSSENNEVIVKLF
ncbi:MAG: hypothetical protein NC548_53155 [Lachnospiraceae bacterium]|nr:hypothetical protein [Lachnospiraceae bacterium]